MRRDVLGLGAALLLALTLLVASGRSDSYDGDSQLAVAVHFCSTGHIGTSNRINRDFFRRGSAWYEGNDIGASLLMLPAACLSTLKGTHNPATSKSRSRAAKSARLVKLTPALAKGLSSIWFALIGGFGVVFVFLALDRWTSTTRAWWWAVAFLFATAYVAYIKGLWDVLPAASGVAALTYVVSRKPGSRGLYAAAAAIGFASLCRYSLLPFLVIGSIFALWPTIRAAPPKHLVGAAILLFVLVLPDFAYNQLRTGSFWKPGEVSHLHHLTSSYVLGTSRMYFGFGRGLLFYAPMCVLGWFAALLFVVRSQRHRLLAAGVLLMITAYGITVSLVQVWFAFGWGPRYLVPMLPALFVIGVVAVERFAPKLGYFAVGLGLLTQLPVSYVNWVAVMGVTGKPRSPSWAPNAIVGIWHSALHAVSYGHGLGSAQKRSLQAPDAWWWHLVARHVPHVVGLAVLVLAAVAIIAAWAYRKSVLSFILPSHSEREATAAAPALSPPEDSFR
jgi:hypothetical protein